MDVMVFSNKENEYEEIFNFFKIVESYYYPPLSERGPLTEFIDPLINKGNIIYLKEKNKIIGMITYYYNYKDSKAAYIDSISILPEFRGKKLSKLLVEKCFSDLISKKTKNVKVRTWSTNKVTLALYPHLGFKIYKTVKDDRGPCIDSIYFEKDLGPT